MAAGMASATWALFQSAPTGEGGRCDRAQELDAMAVVSIRAHR